MIPFIGVLAVRIARLKSPIVPDFVRHVCQEFTLTPVGRFGLLSGARILLDRLSEVVHHLIDLRLQTVHFTTRFDRDEPSEISIGSGG